MAVLDEFDDDEAAPPEDCGPDETCPASSHAA